MPYTPPILGEDPWGQKLLDTLADLNLAPRPWAASTAYAAGQYVISPTGRTVKRIAAGTSGTTYDATQWTDEAAPRGAAWTPEDVGLLAATGDPATCSVSGAAVAPAGDLHTARVWLPRPVTVTSIVAGIITAGAGLTAGQCGAALYQGAVLKRATGDLAASMAVTGQKTWTLASPIALDPAQGPVDIALWFNGTTGPAMMRFINTATTGVNYGLPTSGYRFGRVTGAGATTAAPATLGTMTTPAGGTCMWLALI